ncbi:MAG: Xaa-Pro peptidase family protein [Candidatus Sulfobium sp.]|jgi:Xaa-Pro aminopeptidase
MLHTVPKVKENHDLKSESKARISRLQARLRQEDVDGALLPYSVDLYYFTGSRQNGVLWVPAEGSPLHLVRKSYTRALSESAVTEVRPFPPSSGFSGLLNPKARRIGLTFDVMPVQSYRFYKGVLPGREFIDISAINRELRSVKSAFELHLMRVSAGKLCEVFSQVPGFLKPGMRELDLAAEFEFRLRKSGHEGYLRMRAFNQETTGLAAAGESAATPGCFDGPIAGRGLSAAAPFGPSASVIRENVPVVVDYGVAVNGYMVDMTRIFVIGSPAPHVRKAFDAAVDIQAWLAGNLRAGKIWEELFLGAARMAQAAGLGDYFMGYPGEQAKFVGHGVGLELDELPVLAPRFRLPLRAGHTIAVEPKFVFPGLGAVGIENTYAVSDSACEKLTPFPDDLVCL